MTSLATATHSVMSADSSDALRAGLTETDAARIAAAISAARADSTRAVYAHAWNQWERWCAARDLSPLPAQPLAICAYLIDRAESGRSMATLNLACTAIRYVHRHCGAPDPVTETVRHVRQGLRRIHGTAPRRLAHPLTVREVGQVVGGIDRATPIGIRDTAIILLGFASAMRRSELVALRLDDITHHPDGLMLTVRQSKTDPHGRGQIVAVAHGQNLRTDPVAALVAWCETRGHIPGPLFTRLDRTSMSRQPISGHVVARMLRVRAIAAGLDGTRITAHSLRAGHATAAAVAGISLERIAAQTRHRDISVLVNGYIRPVEALARTSSRDLGL
jgi:integrase